MTAPRPPPEESRTTTRAFDDDRAPLYTVGQVADMLDVQPAFLRRLDSEAVVQPARSEGGQRRYTRLDIYLVERVVGLAEEGLTLAGIRRLLVLEDQVRDLQRQLDDQQPPRRAVAQPTTTDTSREAKAPTKIVAGDAGNHDPTSKGR